MTTGDLVKVEGSGFGVVRSLGENLENDITDYVELYSLGDRYQKYGGWVAQFRFIQPAVWTFHGPVRCPER